MKRAKIFTFDDVNEYFFFLVLPSAFGFHVCTEYGLLCHRGTRGGHCEGNECR